MSISARPEIDAALVILAKLGVSPCDQRRRSLHAAHRRGNSPFAGGIAPDRTPHAGLVRAQRDLMQQLARRKGARNMAERNAQVGRPAGRVGHEWAGGFTVFAGVMMIIVGVFHAAAGLAGIIENEFYVVTPNYLYSFDATSWGWVHLLLGILVAAAGFAVFAGRLWARAVGIVLATLSAIANFLFLPYYPIWSVLIIALDVFVIWALIVHGRTSRA
jgi:hypothetical protein